MKQIPGIKFQVPNNTQKTKPKNSICLASLEMELGIWFPPSRGFIDFYHGHGYNPDSPPHAD
jgi:hypothetical protein